MRLIAILLTAAAMFVAPSAGAIELFLVGDTSQARTIDVGQDLVIELRMSNVSQTAAFGLGASVHGYEGGLSFISGRAVRRYLNDGDGTYINNLAGTSSGGTGLALQRVLAPNRIGANTERVQIALSAGTSPNLGVDPSIDPGLEGTTSPMFRLTFRGLNPGTYTMLIDSSYQGDLVNIEGGDEEILGTSIVVTVVPEPGTALLMGLGLAGLAVAGRRE